MSTHVATYVSDITVSPKSIWLASTHQVCGVTEVRLELSFVSVITTTQIAQELDLITPLD